MRRVILFVLLASVLALGAWLPISAMWRSDGTWVRTRQDDELIALTLASKDPTIGVVYLLKTPNRVDAMLQKIHGLGGSASHVDRTLGYIRATVPTAAVRDALTVPAGDVASVDVDLSRHAPSEGGEPVMPPANQQRIQAEIDSPATQQFLRASSPILHDLHADAWQRANPTFDGRGVVIADVEDLPDPMIPELSGALSLEGKPIRKIEGLHVVIDPDDHQGGSDVSSQWVAMRPLPRASGSVNYNGTSYQLPHAGTFRIGTFNLDKLIRITHWLSPKTLEPAIGNGIFTVLWEPSSGLVWVDTHHSGDFRNVRAMRDFNVSGDWSYFGAMHSAKNPLLKPAVSFVVLEDPRRETVAIALGFGVHAAGVTTAAAGNPVDAKDPVHGVARAAQIASFEYQDYELHSLSEALIAAFEDPKVDTVVFEWSHAIWTIPSSEDGWFLGALGERLVKRFDKPLFVPGSNGNQIASIDDAGIGADVIEVSGSQSAQSYLRYDGFLPATTIHKHWGGLTDGPGQDGQLKPDLLAPSGYTGAAQKYFWDPASARKPGLYTLPAGFQQFGGTSEATPTAGGASALLLSAMKQRGIHMHEDAFANAMRLGAFASPQLAAHEEGNGLIDVAATWKILQSNAASASSSLALARVCGGSVRTPQWPNGSPNGGTGIFETIGWHPGDSGTRTMRFCLPATTQGKITASLLLNDGTYRIAGVQSSGQSVTVAVGIQPARPGFHSALVQINNARGRILGRGMVTIGAADTLTAANHYTMKQTIVIPRPGYTATFVEVPKGTDALVLQSDRDVPFSVMIQDPSGLNYNYIPIQYFAATSHHSITIPAPMAGPWAIILSDTHDVASATHEVLSVEALPATLTIQAVRVQRGTEPATTSSFAKLPVHEVGSVQTLAKTSGQFPSRNPVLIPIDVPKNTDALMVDLSGTDPWVDGYVFNCSTKTCYPFARILGNGSDKRLTIPNVSRGHYVVALDSFDPIRSGTALPNYDVSILAYDRFASSASTDATTARAYEVNCEPPGGGIFASPQCGLFITNEKGSNQ